MKSHLEPVKSKPGSLVSHDSTIQGFNDHRASGMPAMTTDPHPATSDRRFHSKTTDNRFIESRGTKYRGLHLMNSGKCFTCLQFCHWISAKNVFSLVNGRRVTGFFDWLYSLFFELTNRESSLQSKRILSASTKCSQVKKFWNQTLEKMKMLFL
jgi:hypothetical protein